MRGLRVRPLVVRISRRKTLQLVGTLVPATAAGCLADSSATTPASDCETASPEPAPDSWPMAGGGATNDGYTPLDTSASGQPETRTLETNDSWTGTGSHVYGDGVLYLGADHDEIGVEDDEVGAVYALDGSTGEQHWRTETPEPVTGTPALDDTTVYVPSGRDDSNTGPGTGYLHAVARDTGDELWRSDIGGKTDSFPVATEDLVCIARDTGQDSWLFAFDAATGEEAWRFDAGDHVFGWPAVTNDEVYAVVGQRRLVVLDRQTGEEQWQFGGDDEPRLSSPPTVVDGTVFVGARRGVVAIDACSGERLWTLRTDDEATEYPELVFAGVSVAGDTLYAPVVRDGHSAAASLAAVDVTSGTTRWTTELTDSFWVSKPVVTETTVYVGIGQTPRGVRAFDRADGTRRWESDRGGKQPIVADGTLYATDAERIHAFALAD